MLLCALLPISLLILPMLSSCHTKVRYLRSRCCKTHFGVCTQITVKYDFVYAPTRHNALLFVSNYFYPIALVLTLISV